MWARIRRALRSIPPQAIDVVLALACCAVGQLELRNGTDDGYVVGSLAYNTVFVVVFSATLLIRRRWPEISFLSMQLLLAGTMLIAPHALFFFATWVPSMITTFTVARYGRGRIAAWAWLSGGLFYGLLMYGATSQLRHEDANPLLPAGIPVVVWLVGRALARMADQKEELGHAVERLQVEQAAGERAAVDAERARIAAEMHDVVAHAVSLMVVQVGAARMGLERDRGPLPRLRAAEDSGRVALTELRRSLGVLRGNAGGELAPLPGLAALPALVEQLRLAGLTVTLTCDAGTEDLPPSVQLAAYRIVQEALTNALVHGDGRTASAEVSRVGDEILLVVRNPVRTGTRDRVRDGAAVHQGLIGMRERVGVFGGTLLAGREDDDYVVRARLPYARTTVAA